jgi:hypothetical protein
MDDQSFDRLARNLASPLSRRHLLRRAFSGLALSIGIGASASTLLDPSGVDAAGKCRKQGEICRFGSDCCSGNCLPPDRMGRSRCGAEPVPMGGACTVTSQCEPGLTCCGGTCVDTDSDPSHCGACGNTCPGPEWTCAFSTCVLILNAN